MIASQLNKLESVYNAKIRKLGEEITKLEAEFADKKSELITVYLKLVTGKSCFDDVLFLESGMLEVFDGENYVYPKVSSSEASRIINDLGLKDVRIWPEWSNLSADSVVIFESGNYDLDVNKVILMSKMVGINNTRQFILQMGTRVMVVYPKTFILATEPVNVIAEFKITLNGIEFMHGDGIYSCFETMAELEAMISGMNKK